MSDTGRILRYKTICLFTTEHQKYMYTSRSILKTELRSQFSKYLNYQRYHKYFYRVNFKLRTFFLFEDRYVIIQIKFCFVCITDF